MGLSRIWSKAVGIFSCLSPDRNRHGAKAALPAQLALFLTLFLPGMAASQSITKISGYVYDAVDGNPLPRAVVRIGNSDFSTQTDYFGYYFLNNLPNGRYRLIVEAEGYERRYSSDIEVVTDIARRIDFHLDRKIYQLVEREVRGKRTQSITDDGFVIDIETIKKSDADNLAEILETVEGVHIMKSGSAGTPARASIRGCDPKHVLILIDGQRVTPAGSGVADLNTIPLEIIEKIEVYRGGESTRFGTDAIGGVINIITHVRSAGGAPEIFAEKSWGKWKTDHYEITAVNIIPAADLSSKFSHSFRGTGGRFDYDYHVSSGNGSAETYTGVRENADINNRSYFLSGHHAFSSRTSISLSGQSYRSRQGLPGSVSRIDLTARKRDERYLASVRFVHDFSPKHNLELSLGYTRFKQHFNNVNHPSSSERYETEYKDDIFNIRAGSLSRLAPGNEFTAGIALQRNILYHYDLYRPIQSMGRTIRDNMGVFSAVRQTIDLGKLPYGNVAVFGLSLRWDNTNTRKDSTAPADTTGIIHFSQWSKKSSVSLSFGGKNHLIIRGSYGTSFRLPSFNALFWKEDVRSRGNPYLRPERAEHSEVGMEIGIDGRMKISTGITYFHTFIKDLVVWRPGHLGWMPINLDAALITGHEEFFKLSLFGEKIRFSYQNTITVPQNKNYESSFYNNFLTYRPHYFTNLECALNIWIVHASYNIRLVDIRYAKEGNTRWYDAYRIDNLNLGFKTAVSALTVGGSYRIKNLGSEDYVLIAHYPMPGREWSIETSVSYSIE